MLKQHINKIILGTVQFGLNYGINNITGQVSRQNVKNILSTCQENGIIKLDTSAAYGNSEQVLGEFIGNDFDVISKYPRCDQSVQSVFKNSLVYLGIDQVYGYLIHHFDIFQECPSILDELSLLKEKKKIRKIGFSIYKTKELDFLLNNNIQFDLIQFPYNIFDRTFESYLHVLKERNIEIHIRSVFLQGLFFKDLETLPKKLHPLKVYLSELNAFCREQSISIEEVALNYAIHNKYIDGVLIGVDNPMQLINNINSIWDTYPLEVSDFISLINIKEKELLHPNNWN